MASLASFHKVLSPILGFTEAALYERQRALVRAGVLPKASGRGRSSGGAEASPETVAWLVLSLLATDNLSEVAVQTPRLANFKTWKKLVTRSPFEPDSTLLKAVTTLLGQPSLCQCIGEVYVLRKSFAARISSSDRPLPEPSFPRDAPYVTFFNADDDDRVEPPAIMVGAEIAGHILCEIAEILAREEWQ